MRELKEYHKAPDDATIIQGIERNEFDVLSAALKNNKADKANELARDLVRDAYQSAIDVKPEIVGDNLYLKIYLEGKEQPVKMRLMRMH